MDEQDYKEKCCCAVDNGSIPTDRVIDRLDKYLAADDYASAERHLTYWLGEATALADTRGMLLVEGELIGLYRKIGNKEKALEFSQKALELAAAYFEGTVTLATTYVNAATAHSAFGNTETALELYQKARELYEKLLSPDDARLGGLYNNMGVAALASGDIERARALFVAALGIMGLVEGGETGIAITYCNLADLAAAEFGEIDGESAISDCLEKAMRVLDSVIDRTDGEYAYACEKCAATFGYYGFFVYENTLTERARGIYERT